MSWKTKTDLLMRHCTSSVAFGEPLTFAPVIGVAQVINGIWSDTYLSVNPSDGIEVMSNDPNLGAKISDFLQIPVRKDIFFRGTARYEVREVQPDGESGVIIILDERPL